MLYFGLVFVSSTGVFFLGAFGFENFTTGSHSYYASELVCGGPAATSLCTANAQPDTRLFRGSLDEPRQLQEREPRYFSRPFAWVLSQVHSETDTLREATIKVFLAKALIAGALTAYCTALCAAFPGLRPLAIRLFIVAFSIPHLWLGVSSFYTAGMASAALIATLLTITVFEENLALSRSWHFSLILIFMLLSLLIGTNRFETYCCLILSVVLTIRKIFSTASRKSLQSSTVTLSVASLIVFGLIFQINETLRRFLGLYLNGPGLKVLPIGASAESRLSALNDASFSLLAPLTFVDNTSRDILHRLDIDFNYLSLVLIGSWTPVLTVFVRLGIDVARNLRSKVPMAAKLVSHMNLLIWLVLFLVIPWLARTVWFYWYALPFLLAIVVAAPRASRVTAVETSLSVVVVSVNLTFFYLVNNEFGPLHLGGFAMNSLLLTILVFLLACIGIVSGTTVVRMRQSS